VINFIYVQIIYLIDDHIMKSRTGPGVVGRSACISKPAKIH
jgi:hypothetical protein